ncbi:hypothetical protein PT974_01341 [Cladobotryum mycophilum]|uniref:Uncharacterized protein n=1 Tax=Cladobotryum mycophilum TaxID=491253 RepID=A0ABR0T4C3_9HYPO
MSPGTDRKGKGVLNPRGPPFNAEHVIYFIYFVRAAAAAPCRTAATPAVQQTPAAQTLAVHPPPQPAANAFHLKYEASVARDAMDAHQLILGTTIKLSLQQQRTVWNKNVRRHYNTDPSGDYVGATRASAAASAAASNAAQNNIVVNGLKIPMGPPSPRQSAPTSATSQSSAAHHGYGHGHGHGHSQTGQFVDQSSQTTVQYHQASQSFVNQSTQTAFQHHQNRGQALYHDQAQAPYHSNGQGQTQLPNASYSDDENYSGQYSGSSSGASTPTSVTDNNYDRIMSIFNTPTAMWESLGDRVDTHSMVQAEQDQAQEFQARESQARAAQESQAQAAQAPSIPQPDDNPLMDDLAVPPQAPNTPELSAVQWIVAQGSQLIAVDQQW